MEISIELIIIVALICLSVFWFIWDKASRWNDERRYKSENDRGKRGEDKRRADRDAPKSDKSVSIPIQSGEREVLQAGDDSASGKNSSGFGGIFKNLFAGRKR